MKISLRPSFQPKNPKAFKQVTLHYTGSAVVNSQLIYNYRILHLNNLLIKTLEQPSPIHPYIVPGTHFKCYLANGQLHQTEDNEGKTKVYCEIIGQHSPRKTNNYRERIQQLLSQDLFVIKYESYLIYDIMNDIFYQTQELSSLRYWDLYLSADPQLIKRPATFHKLTAKEKQQLVLSLPSFKPLPKTRKLANGSLKSSLIL